MKAKRGEWRQAAQEFAERQAQKTARAVWLAYWKKFDRLRRQHQKRAAKVAA